jgi:hypothetical protein
VHVQKYKYVGELPTSISKFQAHSLLYQGPTLHSKPPYQPIHYISCNSYIAMYLNTVMLSLLLGTAFMTVQLTTARSNPMVQVNIYSDYFCKNYVTSLYPNDSCDPIPVPIVNGSLMLVCQPENKCIEVSFSERDNCPKEAYNLFTYQCPCPDSDGGPDPRNDRSCETPWSFVPANHTAHWFKTSNIAE